MDAPETTKHSKFKHWPLTAAIGTIVACAIVFFLLPAPTKDYVLSLFTPGVDKSITEDAVIAVLLIIVACITTMAVKVIGYVLSHKDTSSGWRSTFSELREALEWIGLIYLVIGFVLWICVIGPYKTVAQLKEDVGVLTQATNKLSKQIIGLTNDISVANVRLLILSNDDAQFVDSEWETVSVRLHNPYDPCDWIDCGRSAVVHDAWQLAARYFTNAISHDNGHIDFCEARVWPLLHLAILESDPISAHAESVGIFNESMERETNKIIFAVGSGTNSASEFGQSLLLSNNLQDLSFVRDVLNETHETNAIPVINEIIRAVDTLAREAKKNGR